MEVVGVAPLAAGNYSEADRDIQEARKAGDTALVHAGAGGERPGEIGLLHLAAAIFQRYGAQAGEIHRSDAVTAFAVVVAAHAAPFFGAMTFFRAMPVKLFLERITCSGVPATTILPPSSPP